MIHRKLKFHYIPQRMNDADKADAVKEWVISHTIIKANGTMQPPKRVQN
jgi:hypothetical protein